MAWAWSLLIHGNVSQYYAFVLDGDVVTIDSADGVSEQFHTSFFGNPATPYTDVIVGILVNKQIQSFFSIKLSKALLYRPWWSESNEYHGYNKRK